MFASNVGFRRRTVSEGQNQLLLSTPNRHAGSSGLHRYSVDDPSSTEVKRIVLRKHSSEPTSSRGLADRLAMCEDESISGFWSLRLSGQKRSVPSSPRQTESGVSEWRMEAKAKAETHTAAAGVDRGRSRSKPGGPRPLTVTSRPTSTMGTSLNKVSSPPGTPQKALPLTPPVTTRSVEYLQLRPLDLSDLSHWQANDKSVNSGNSSGAELSRDTSPSYRPLLPPGLPPPDKPPLRSALKPAREAKEAKKERVKDKDVVKDKEKRRFAHLELTLSKLVGGGISNKKAASSQSKSTAITVCDEKHSKALVPASSLSVKRIPLPPIPIPPIPESLPPIYRARAHAAQISRQSLKSIKSVKSTKSSKSAKSSKSGKSGKTRRRKSSRKRKTGLARIVVEVAKGGQVAAVEAEALQEAAQLNIVFRMCGQFKLELRNTSLPRDDLADLAEDVDLELAPSG
ncbi:uncharacterized protein FOMMEDRAFT_145005 [Fomitiporia mediterranea MF3/22]|uniref:uncharacterized protein n=1 Tax=Fomitiporia mediterranea (strain MF3/22) TaxID=694068 RepID=UPI0004407E7D|nr:uncharacterized protein FOMMEDRAFT_145005 [Fomitiporia mediterranea MF3/22]EJD05466.1 hypothetical protein FOMMEDRAFT_145005 [Fomitiporia mediterranea MF3/22]